MHLRLQAAGSTGFLQVETSSSDRSEDVWPDEFEGSFIEIVKAQKTVSRQLCVFFTSAFSF